MFNFRFPYNFTAREFITYIEKYLHVITAYTDPSTPLSDPAQAGETNHPTDDPTEPSVNDEINEEDSEFWREYNIKNEKKLSPRIIEEVVINQSTKESQVDMEAEREESEGSENEYEDEEVDPSVAFKALSPTERAVLTKQVNIMYILMFINQLSNQPYTSPSRPIHS